MSNALDVVWGGALGITLGTNGLTFFSPIFGARNQKLGWKYLGGFWLVRVPSLNLRYGKSPSEQLNVQKGATVT